MMQKYITRSLIFLFTLFLYSTQTALCAEQTPEQFVREFYQWYFDADSGSIRADNKNEIYTYVEKNLVKHIRENRNDISYFTKTGNAAYGWDEKVPIVNKSIQMDDDTFTVPVLLKSKSDNVHVIVLVKRKNASYLVIKIIDKYPHS